MISAFPETLLNPYCLVVDECWDSLPSSALSSGARSASARYPLPPRFTTVHLILQEDERLRQWRRRKVLRQANWSTLIATSRPNAFGRARGGTRTAATVPLLILPVVICLSQRLCHACLSASHIKVKSGMAELFSCGSLYGGQLLG